MIPTNLSGLGQQRDPFFDQFQPVSYDPASATGNTGINPNSGPATGATTAPTMDLSGLPAPFHNMPTGGASGQPWDQNYFATTFGTPKTPQELIALESKIVAAGGKVLRNAAGVAGKIQTPDGRIVDVINAAGAGGNGFQWLDGGGGAGGNSSSSLSSLGYNFGDSMKPWTEQFSAPTADQALSTPGLQFGLDEANRMMQNSAAARGTLLNGRTNQAMAASNINNALQAYGQVYDRGLSEYGLRRDNFFQNQDRPFSKNLQLAELGKPT